MGGGELAWNSCNLRLTVCSPRAFSLWWRSDSVLSIESQGFWISSHAVLFVIAPYAAYCSITWFGAPLWLAALVGVMSSAAIGSLLGIALYAPLRRRHGTWLTLCLASLGIYVVLRNVISLACGDDVKSIRTWQATEGIDVLGARVTAVQLDDHGNECTHDMRHGDLPASNASW